MVDLRKMVLPLIDASRDRRRGAFGYLHSHVSERLGFESIQVQ